MDNYEIVLKAGEILEKKILFSEVDLQRFIGNVEGHTLPIKDIRIVLDALVKSGFLDIHSGDSLLCVYKRFVPMERRKNGKMLAVRKED